ncbi:MAG: DUF1127 domain-containing protein [Marinibacterium sp.]
MTRTLTAQTLMPLTASPRLPLIAALAVQVALVVTEWSHRRRSRRVLADLDDHLLKDIGLTREIARKEAIRPFWQG